MTKTKILVFASNPQNTDALMLGEEVRAITKKIREAEYRDSLEFNTAWAARPTDLLDEMNRYLPAIVHFSGHGSGEEGLVFTNDLGKAEFVTAETMEALFSTLKNNVRLIVLNACFSVVQGEAISRVIDCVIGMDKSIGDRAAILFAAYFYSAIAYGHSVKDAFNQGILALKLEGITEDKTPVLLCKNDIDPDKVYVVHEGNPQPEGYNIQKIINMMTDSFNDTELQQFCMNHYNDVYNSFTNGMDKTQKILILVSYSKRRLLLDSLLDNLSVTNPAQFDKYKPYKISHE